MKHPTSKKKPLIETPKPKPKPKEDGESKIAGNSKKSMLSFNRGNKP